MSGALEPLLHIAWLSGGNALRGPFTNNKSLVFILLCMPDQSKDIKLERGNDMF